MSYSNCMEHAKRVVATHKSGTTIRFASINEAARYFSVSAPDIKSLIQSGGCSRRGFSFTFE